MSFKNPEPDEELLRCFDEQGNEIEPHTRTECHEQPLRFWHGTTGIWVINFKGEILCSKRSEKLKQKPGLWQTRFGGHVRHDQTFLQNAVSELEEEIGIVAKETDLKQIVYMRPNSEFKHFSTLYVYLYKGDSSDCEFKDGEITEMKWMGIEDSWEDGQKNPEKWTSRCNPEFWEMIKKVLR